MAVLINLKNTFYHLKQKFRHALKEVQEFKEFHGQTYRFFLGYDHQGLRE